MKNNWITKTKRKVENVTTKLMGKRRKKKFKLTPQVVQRETIKVPSLTPIPKIELAIKPNYDRLMQLLEIRTYSKSVMQDMLIARLQEHFIEFGGVTHKDAYGNLYVTKGNAEFYPCVVGHTDINQEKRNNVKVMTAYPWIFGFDADKAEQCGIGADDKVGVYFAVHMFDLFDNIKLFFPKDEEIGLIGTYQAEKEFFADCSILIQLDRNSYKNDLITYTNGITVCSNEFVEAAGEIMDKYGYAKNNGSCTDIGGLKKSDVVKCVAMNVSCGYINEHSDSEVISIPHFENAINFGYELLKMGVDRVWEHKVEIPKYDSYGSYGSYGTYGNYYSRSTLFDDDYGFSENENNSKYFGSVRYDDNGMPITKYSIESPTGKKIEIPLKYKDEDEFYLSEYEVLMYPSFREEYLESTTYPEETDPDTVSYLEDQSYIDACLADGMCPCCFNNVEITNRLMIYLDCMYCGSQWNHPTVDTNETKYNIPNSSNDVN